MDLISINGSEIKSVEYKEQRVVTFKMVDELHQRVSGTARKAFNRNKDKFILEKDYFFVKPEDVGASFKGTSEINNSGTYLLTERGYLKLVKPFGDELSWQVQDMLVDCYFKLKEVAKDFSNNEMILRMLAQSNEVIKQNNENQKALTQLIKNLDKKLSTLETKENVKSLKKGRKTKKEKILKLKSQILKKYNSIIEFCKACGFNQSTFYRHLSNMGKKTSSQIRFEELIEEKLK